MYSGLLFPIFGAKYGYGTLDFLGSSAVNDRWLLSLIHLWLQALSCQTPQLLSVAEIYFRPTRLMIFFPMLFYPGSSFCHIHILIFLCPASLLAITSCLGLSSPRGGVRPDEYSLSYGSPLTSRSCSVFSSRVSLKVLLPKPWMTLTYPFEKISLTKICSWVCGLWGLWTFAKVGLSITSLTDLWGVASAHGHIPNQKSVWLKLHLAYFLPIHHLSFSLYPLSFSVV